ncbi:MAG: rhodanese-like domain-containing protein [Defluviitaleaceae bacterium]|nr:rhodanese-like domain-containing protein [Defluviitaleaceae bacterium]
MENFIANINLPTILFMVLLIAILMFILYSRHTMKKNVNFLDEQAFAQTMRKGQLIDVRKKDEFEQGHINGSRNIPLAMLTKSMSKLRGDQPIYLVCADDKQSQRATMLLMSKNFTTVYALKGGIAGWSKPLKVKK